MLREITINPFLWQRLLVLAVERERQGEAIGSYELPSLCGIPRCDAVEYLKELGRVRGWIDVPVGHALIPINPDGSDRNPY